jgi:glucose/arabinose dehydrogenase
LLALAACSGGGGSSSPSGGSLPGATATPAATTTPSPAPTGTPYSGATAPPANAQLQVPSGFAVSVIANVPEARELAALPNGDLIVGSEGTTIWIVPNADGPGAAGTPSHFADISDTPAQGVAFGDGYVFAATQHGVYRMAYTTGALTGTSQQIASVRQGTVAPNSDGDVHTTSSVALSGTTLYVGVGSSCNACTEVDPTRATVQKMGVDGSGMTTQATQLRNAIALATDPTTGNVWAGGAGQDDLTEYHPYEFMDPVSTRTAPANYGWPACEENHVAYTSGANCSTEVAPALEFPAYSTLIGAAFYPANQSGAYAFPSAWRGGLFVSAHGSWHANSSGVPLDPPHVAFVPFSGSMPATAVNWSNPAAQWNDFFTGFQSASGSRIGRTTGVAVGPNGSLFVADDQNGVVYRIRPLGTGTQSIRRNR